MFAALAATASGSPPASVSTCSFEPGLPRSTGFGPVSSPIFRPHVGGVDHRAGPVDRRLLAEPIQYRPVQSPPQPGLGPGHEAAVGGRLGDAELRGQVSLGAAGGQHVDDRGEHRPVTHLPGATALRALGLRWDQRLDELPQPVEHHFPAQSFCYDRTTARRSPVIHVRQALSRHGTGDWGDLEEEDKKSNEKSLIGGGGRIDPRPCCHAARATEPTRTRCARVARPGRGGIRDGLHRQTIPQVRRPSVVP